MTGPVDGGGVRSAVVAQNAEHVLGAARIEAVRLGDGLRLAVSALSAIEDRARGPVADSARVRSLGFECLPRGYYIAHCVSQLRDELGSARPRRRVLRRARANVEELTGLLDRVVDVTTTVDVSGELDLPLELVGVAQSGAVAGLARLTRLSESFDLLETGPRTRALPGAVGPRPSRPARLLVGMAGRLLPVGSRDRYVEEFHGELAALVDDRVDRGAQLAHAIRLVAVLWSLRRALPSGPPPSTGRVRADRRSARVRVRWLSPAWESARTRIDRRIDRWAARTELRAQARAQRRLSGRPATGRPGSPAHARRRTGIPVLRRLR